MTCELARPLADVADLASIENRLNSMSLDDLLEVLESKHILVWPLRLSGKQIFITKDFESKHKGNVWASALGSVNNIITLYFNANFGVKIFLERELHNILWGLLVHEAYEGLLSLYFNDVRTEVGVHDNDLKLAGIADVVVPNCVLELKSGRRRPGHILQLAAYMKALGIRHGALVYQHDVKLVEYSDQLEQVLRNAVNSLHDKLRVVRTVSLDELMRRYNRDYEAFKSRIGVEPKELLEALMNEGFA